MTEYPIDFGEQSDHMSASDRVRVLNLARNLDKPGWSLFPKLNHQCNQAISPLSISMCLAMLLPGAAGPMLRELTEILGIDRPVSDSLPLIGKFINCIAGGAQSEQSRLHMANGAFLSDTAGSVAPAYLDAIRQYLCADCVSVDFSHQNQTMDIINEWVNRRTRGRIPELFRLGDLSNETILILVNALYMDTQWMFQFDLEHTKPELFYIDDHEKDVAVEVQMMRGEFASPVRRHNGGHFTAVTLPMQGGLSFEVILPEKGYFEDVLDSMSPNYLSDTTNVSTNVDLGIPRFSMESTSEIGALLQEEGLKTAFDTQADMSGICDAEGGFGIGNIVHKVRVEVAEEGVKAAAVTANLFVMARPEDRFIETERMTVDRPFFYRISENLVKLSLFLASVRNPQE